MSRTLRAFFWTFLFLGVLAMYAITNQLIVDPTVQLFVILPAASGMMIVVCIMFWGSYKYGRNWLFPNFQKAPIDDPSKRQPTKIDQEDET
jgi:uncharacterized membrane protein